MKKIGKNIELFLIDGEPNGRMTCELSNWRGRAYLIPRIKIKDCDDRPDLKNPGVYLLFGENETGKDLIYIGEAEEVYKRLKEQLQRDFWTVAIVFVGVDGNLNKAYIKYLENRLFDLAKTVNRYQIENKDIPTLSSISESKRAEMEEFIQNIKILVNILGHKVFEEKRETKAFGQQTRETFYIKSARGADAQGEPTSDGFVVFKGSKVAISTVPLITSNFKKLREEFIENGIITKNNETLEFSEDHVFSSPSAAAVMVLGRSANGLTEWKLNDGTMLRDFELEKNKNAS
jgi:hypothetical protein